MRSFRVHLKEKLKNDHFRRLYEEERQLAKLSLEILDTREHLGLSQSEAAKRARITQQQLSKIEKGINCNLVTFLKVCNVLQSRWSGSIGKSHGLLNKLAALRARPKVNSSILPASQEHSTGQSFPSPVRRRQALPLKIERKTVSASSCNFLL